MTDRGRGLKLDLDEADNHVARFDSSLIKSNYLRDYFLLAEITLFMSHKSSFILNCDSVI